MKWYWDKSCKLIRASQSPFKCSKKIQIWIFLDLSEPKSHLQIPLISAEHRAGGICATFAAEPRSFNPPYSTAAWVSSHVSMRNIWQTVQLFQTISRSKLELYLYRKIYHSSIHYIHYCTAIWFNIFFKIPLFYLDHRPSYLTRRGHGDFPQGPIFFSPVQNSNLKLGWTNS